MQKEDVPYYQTVPLAAAKRIEIVMERTSSIKSLTGFKKGHTIPPKLAAKTQVFVNSLAEPDISEHIEKVTSKLCALFNLKVDDFEVRQKGGEAVFECAFLIYEYSMAVDPDRLSDVIFTSKLAPINLAKMLEQSAGLDACFPGWFDYLQYQLSKSLDLKQLVRDMENAKEAGSMGNFEYSYDSQVTLLKVADLDKGRHYELSADSVKILFRAKEKMVEMLDSLKDLSNKIASLSSDKLLDA